MNLPTHPFSQSGSKKSLLLFMCFILLSTFGFSQTTVTKSYSAPSSVTIDGCGTYCTNLPGVVFSATDFSAGACQVTDVNVNIVWAKTDGTCLAPGTGSSFHNETNFRIDGPSNNVILVQPGTYTGSATMSSVSTTFNQGSTVVGGVTPVSGTFGPNNGNLNDFNGTNPFGTWALRAGDTGGGDPLCVVGYSVTITVSIGTDTDGDGTCDAIDTDDDNDGVADGSDLSSLDPNICGDSDADGCDDCSVGTDDFGPLSDFSPANDGTDTDGDGICDLGDSDDDNDGVADVSDSAPLNPDICADADGDGCDDCSVGTDNFGPLADNLPANDGTDTDGDGICNTTDTDDDNDGVLDGADVSPLNPFICGDADFDGCDDCSIGVDGFGPLADNNPANDGTDTDGDGLCDLGDPDDDNDGVPDVADTSPLDPNICADADGDGCDDCSVGTDDFGPLADNLPANDGTDTDGDGICDTGDSDDDNDGVADGLDSAPLDPNLCADADGDGCDDCSVGTDDFGPLADNLPANDGTDTDGDGICDTGDSDDDNDGVADASDIDPMNPFVCQDLDGDGCDDCSVGVDGFGPLADFDPNNDDNTAPVADVATLADVTAECEVTSLTDPTATDNCSATVTVTNDATLPITTQGTTIVTWTYADGNGNSSTQTQNIVLTDATAPVADVATLADVTAECEVTSLTDPSATDNCGGTVTVTNDATLPISTQGTTIVTWTYADANGNSSTQTQNIVLTDATAPVADVATLADVTAECEVTSLTDPSATDNCGGTVTVTNDATLPITTQGTTVVTWTYTDGAGNASTQTQNVVITDVTAPVADVATLADVTDECSVTALTDPTATDNCGGLVTVTNDATLPITTQGTTVVTWTYTDVNGNASTQTQNVVITDVTAPVADVATLTDVTDECSVTSLTGPTATDNCGGLVTVTNDATLPISIQGTTVVTWTYTDVNGNASTQTQNVVITDVTAPVADVATLADVTDECSIATLTDPTATDNCGGLVTVSNDATLPITTQGTTIVTWTYTDVNGNASTQTQNVVITDVTAPVADVATLADVTDECSVATLTDPTATDNCGGVVTATNDATLPITTQGTTVVTWTYTDGAGNASTQTQNVVITDVTAPVADVATLADVTDECSVATLTDPTATDNCGGVVTVTNDATLPITTQGTTVVTWTYTDVHGNASIQTQNVVITDVTAPVADIATLADVTDECSVTSLTDPTATDNCGGLVTVTNDVTLPITTQGTTVVTWTYTDVNGNASTQTQNVVITDVTAPVADVATLADVTDECSIATLTDPTATDNCGGLVTVTNDATLPISIQGTTVVTWTYTDVNGNASTQTQNVVITDVTAPVADVATLADVTDECSIATLTDPTATDNCGGLVTVTNDATLPITTQGTTVVTWTYTDVNGNASTQTQNVVITDVTAPVADVATLTDLTDECSIATLTDPTATDNCGGLVTVTNDATLPITTQGTTVVTWTYTDVNGNTSTQTQNVVITDVTAPVADVATLADVTDECSVTSLTDPTATDNCGGLVTVTNDATLPIATQGTTVVTWTYTDVNGNTSTQTQNVVITDVTAPVADVATLADVTAECEVTTLTDPTATDNCTGMVTVTNDATLPISIQGTTVVTWTYDDGNGNTSTQTQNVVITDVVGPVPNGTLPDLAAICSQDALPAPTATDNCAGLITGTTTTVFPITTIGTTVITWEFADGNGNVTTQTQDVVISGVDLSTSLSPDGTTITSLNAFATYQWIDCSDNSLVIGATSSTFTPVANGDYAVIVTEGSCVDTSACVTVSTVGVGTISIIEMSVYPNPSLDGYFTVSYDGTIEAIEVLDMLGRSIMLPIDLNSGVVDGAELADGRYIIRVKADSGYATSEIVIAN